MNFPLYFILNHLIKIDADSETGQAVLHTLCILASDESGYGSSCKKNRVIILNYIGFVAKVMDYMEKGNMGIHIQTMWIIAQVLSNAPIISKVCPDVFCDVISEVFSNINNTENAALNEITLYFVGSIAALSEHDFDVFSKDNIAFVKKNSH